VDDYIAINRAMWDERAPVHASSPDYGFARFVDDPGHLSSVVRFDQPRLGDISGLRGIHLQCHIGTDTLSLARLGARISGLDFSPPALAAARGLAARTGTDITYYESDVYKAASVVDGPYDLVYTGIGALCWLPAVRPWAQVVASLLRTGGRLFIREGHPMLWAHDETLKPPALGYPYFETADPVVIDDPNPGTYVTTDVTLKVGLSHSWNHGLGEIFTALMDAGLTVTAFEEHNSLPWCAFPGHMTRDDAEEWRLTDHPERLAASYTLQATKHG
jgi:SAM-dependent methyltransferase